MASYYALSESKKYLEKVKGDADFAKEGQAVLHVVLPDGAHHYLNLGGTGGLEVLEGGVLEIRGGDSSSDAVRLYGAWLFTETVPYEVPTKSGRSRATVLA